jgi:hypothetical protein
MTKREKHPQLTPIGDPDRSANEPGRIDCWETLNPCLTDILIRKDVSLVNWPERSPHRMPGRSEIARQELNRMSRAADELAQRKHIAAALAGRDLTPLFDILQDDPFFRHLGKLLQITDHEQRITLLEGVGPVLLESAHWQGWMQHIELPKSDLDAADASASRKVAEMCRGCDEERDGEAPVAKARPAPAAQEHAKRMSLSQSSASRAKQWAANASNVEKNDWLTTREFTQLAGLTNWGLHTLRKKGRLPFQPLAGPKGSPMLWPKADVAIFLAQRSPGSARRDYAGADTRAAHTRQAGAQSSRSTRT